MIDDNTLIQDAAKSANKHSRYEVFEGLEDEDDGSELSTKLHNDNLALTVRVQELEDERDEWKAKVQEMAELNQKISDESLALVEKYGAQAKEAYVLLHLLANQPSVVNTPWGEQLSAQVNDHLQLYEPYQK